MKIGIAMALSNSHVIYLDHLIKSVLAHTPGFSYDWYVFCSPIEDSDRFNLSKKNKDSLSRLYPFKFKAVDAEEYNRKKRGYPIYFSIETFTLRDYDYVVYWGADMLALMDVSELFSWMTENIKEEGDGIGMPMEHRRGNTFNNGSMMVTEKFLNDKTYRELMEFPYWDKKYSDIYGHDQKIYNAYFRPEITVVPSRFNCLVSECDCIPVGQKIVLLHYFLKPTQEDPRRRLAKWMIDEWEKYDNKEGRYYFYE